MPDGDGRDLCQRLTERGIPFLMYCALKPIDGPYKDAPYLSKPSGNAELLDAMEALIRDAKSAS